MSKIIQTKNVIEVVFTYMEYLYNKYSKGHTKTMNNTKCLKDYLFRDSLQLIKIIVVFHIILDIIIRNNCQRSNESLTMQSGFYLWDKLLNVLKLTRANMDNNQNLPQMWIEMRSWTCLEQDNFKNVAFVICTIVLSHLLLMVNNTNSQLVAIKLWQP
jgi:hypothetical protein